MLKSIAKLIGGSSEKAIKKLRPLVDEINEIDQRAKDVPRILWMKFVKEQTK